MSEKLPEGFNESQARALYIISGIRAQEKNLKFWPPIFIENWENHQGGKLSIVWQDQNF